MSKLVAFLLCACASALFDYASLSNQCEEETGNSVSLLQAGTRFQGGLSSQGRRSKDPPTFAVDLDVAPELRWRQVTRYWMDMGIFPKRVLSYKFTDDPAMLSLARTMFVDEEYVRELKGMVSDMGLPESYVDTLLLANSGYELSGNRDGPRGTLDVHGGTISTGCSGLLAAMPNGTVVHGRNMDYGGFEVEANGRVLHYPDVTIEVVFMRDGRPLFTSVHWPGQVGIHTAMRFGGWSFEQNTRHHYMDSSILYGLFRGSQAFVFPARKVMETTPDFETAVQELGKLNLMAPQYFIVAGTGAYEGAVITMDRGGKHAASTPLVTRLSSSKTMLKRDGQIFTNWNIIQTNDDLNQVALDERRPVEELRLARSTQDVVSSDWVFGELTTFPLYSAGTVFTTVCIPGTGYHKTVAHYGHIR